MKFFFGRTDLHGIGLFLTLATCIPAHAQVGTLALGGLQDRLQVALSVSQRSEEVTAGMDIYVEIVNLTEKNVIVEDVEIILPAEVRAIRGNEDLSPKLSSNRQLNPGNGIQVPLRIPDHPTSLYEPLSNHRLLFFFPGDYEVWARVRYSIPPATPTDVLEIVTIQLKPPLSSLLWGGALGALLSSGFIVLYGGLRNTIVSIKKCVQQIVLLFVMGALVSLIALLLIYRIQDLQLPVAVSINDFYGSVVLGLFSAKAGEWLYDLLGGSDQK